MGNGVGPVEVQVRPRRGWYVLAALAVALVAGLGMTLPVLAQSEDAGADPRIVGGEPVPGGKYRFITSIQADVSPRRSPYQEHFCGGTLIDRNSVLTAAHCVVFFGNQTTSNTLGYEDVVLDIGVTVLNSEAGERRGIAELSDVHVHPGYNDRRDFKFDVAVINLARPVTNIKPILLPLPTRRDELETPGDDAIVAGWGDIRQQPAFGAVPSRFPKRMEEATPPLVSDSECAQAYNGPGVPAFLAVAPQLMVCAGQTQEDTCQGDSGGPMFVGTNAANRRQIGITSYGLGCGARGYPGVYTEVNPRPIFGFIRRVS